MGVSSFFCKFVIPFLVLSTAVLLGWLNYDTVSLEGKFFATIIPLMGKVMPPTIVGHGKMKGTPPVPDELVPQPRPEKEILLKLVDGYQIPAVGIGMCCRPTAYDDVLVERTILWFLLQGGRHIDGAHLYLNHEAIGRGIKAAEARGVPRDEIFLTTKLWPAYYGYNTTLETVPKWLDELQVTYVDLVLMHFPTRMPGIKYISKECSALKLSQKECREETWKALSELKTQGVIRSAGVSNFNVKHMKELQSLEGLSPIAVNQFQFGPWSPESAFEAFDHCRNTNIVVTAYNSLGSYTHKDVTRDLVVLQDLANKHSRSIAQILLRWALQLGAVVIPGTGNPKHMKENLDVYSFELSPEDMNAIESLQSKEISNKFLLIDTSKLDVKIGGHPAGFRSEEVVVEHAQRMGWCFVGEYVDSDVLCFCRGYDRMSVYPETDTVSLCFEHPIKGKHELFLKNVDWKMLTALFDGKEVVTDSMFCRRGTGLFGQPEPALVRHNWMADLNKTFEEDSKAIDFAAVFAIGKKRFCTDYFGRYYWGCGIPMKVDQKIRGRQNRLPHVYVIDFGPDHASFLLQFSD
ncbi:2,5-didehydrogluconate reductase [Nitzschia inconspicua]|uniref:2,5-didehydrogluconate reductase n=1 Tax=Nitzschia inconspicua TaxID=303405 RepID=A0A9K3L1H4_9STRA|nr:2,5-didehydrogluconate reductase [Nitzschia inconspicua]